MTKPGKLWGKLYDYDDGENATERTRENWSENSTSGEMRIRSKTGYREPDVVTWGGDSCDADGKIQGYRDGIQEYQMLSQEMEENFYEMIESVKKYGGFYIGRYETGNLNEEEAVVKKMNIGIADATWYTMYEKSKNLAGTNENVETTMIWGSMWDETMEWLIESEAEISTGEKMTYELIAKDSTKWGNYNNAEFEYRTTSGGTAIKSENTSGHLPTGCSEYTKVNNIYDLAGNRYEWTLEADSTNYRVFRGGSYDLSGSNGPAGCRSGIYYPTYSYYYYGCRSALYIK